MIIPDYWAEARKQYKTDKRQITVRRFGWSESSQNEAQAMAESRADEALQRAVLGENVRRRELKVPYNGGQGLPIREEVLERHDDIVITRNSYGAKCLNTPNVLFADVDFPVKNPMQTWLHCVFWTLAVLFSIYSQSWLIGILLVCSATVFSLVVSRMFRAAEARFAAISEQRSRNRLSEFVDRNPDWNVRLYRTPAGLRALATHRTFLPNDSKVQEFFRTMKTDPIYVRMCLNQQCFRARLTAKPWRIGMSHHLKPRPGVWPVAPDSLSIRNGWLAEYDRIAASFASCRFLESLGSGAIHHDVRPVIAIHDYECRANDSTVSIA